MSIHGGLLAHRQCTRYVVRDDLCSDSLRLWLTYYKFVTDPTRRHVAKNACLYRRDRCSRSVHRAGHQKDLTTTSQVLGSTLLITTNCAVLGVALLNTNRAHTLAESAFYGIGGAWILTGSHPFRGIRERLQLADIPAPFQASIALITAGFMALALMGFTGMIRL